MEEPTLLVLKIQSLFKSFQLYIMNYRSKKPACQMYMISLKYCTSLYGFVLSKGILDN